jgi:hypothetical protein
MDPRMIRAGKLAAVGISDINVYGGDQHPPVSLSISLQNLEFETPSVQSCMLIIDICRGNHELMSSTFHTSIFVE